MDATPSRTTPPAFSPQDWMALYLRGEHAALTEAMLGVLGHFRDTSYAVLDARGKRFINEFVKHFLFLFTQSDYVPGRARLAEFVSLNATIANLAAVSSFGTTDAFLEILGDDPSHRSKRMALHSARNRAKPDRRAFFDADPAIASVWFGAYGELYRGGMLREDVCSRLQEHFNSAGPDVDFRLASIDAYFASTYVGGDCDKVIKPRINASVRRANAGRGGTVRNRADRAKIVVVSGNWWPGHSVYRVLNAFVASLARAGYYLTLVHFGGPAPFDTGPFQEVKALAMGSDCALDVSPLLENDYAVAFYPDVGLTPQSVVLANLRLAPIQITGAGHSVSTFGAEMDYYVSGAAVEPPVDPGGNYSERLILLPGSGVVIERPAYTPSGRRKACPDFVLNGPWNAQKVHATFLRTLEDLFRRVEVPLRLRIFVGASLKRRNDYLPFVREVENALGRGRVEVIPGLGYEAYMARMEEGDVCLDSFPFGGCNTVADSLWLRKLTVVREGERWYSRIGPYLLRSVGLPELVATTERDYVEIALRLIHDDTFRKSLQERLDRVDLETTLLDRSDAGYFADAVAYLIEHHARLKAEADRSPIRVGAS